MKKINYTDTDKIGKEDDNLHLNNSYQMEISLSFCYIISIIAYFLYQYLDIHLKLSKTLTNAENYLCKIAFSIINDKIVSDFVTRVYNSFRLQFYNNNQRTKQILFF